MKKFFLIFCDQYSGKNLKFESTSFDYLTLWGIGRVYMSYEKKHKSNLQ